MAIDPTSLSRLFAPFAHGRREMGAVAYFSGNGDLCGMRHVAGLRHHLVLPIRAIAIDALAFDARFVMMAHNHPSGDPEPSEGDLALTRRLARGLETLDVRLVDHIILAGDRRVSLREAGYL